MILEPPVIRGCKPAINKGLYDSMLDQMRAVGHRAVLHLRSLSNVLPTGVIDQVEHLHEDPVHERRKTVRFEDSSIPVVVKGHRLSWNGDEGPQSKRHGNLAPMPCWRRDRDENPGSRET